MFVRLAGILVVAFGLAGCAGAPPLVRGQTDLLVLGDTDASVAAKFGKSLADISHRFSNTGRNYRADHYRLQTGSTQSGTVVCTPTCIYVPITVPVFTPYVVVYAVPENRVIAFGTIEELSKSPDDTVSGFMPSLKLSLEKAMLDRKAGKS